MTVVESIRKASGLIVFFRAIETMTPNRCSKNRLIGYERRIKYRTECIRYSVFGHYRLCSNYRAQIQQSTV
jgi:hypothetical protein